MDTVEEIKEKIQTLQEDYQKEAGKAIYQLATIIFEKFDYLVDIRWKQYIPYFNDGDACTFSLATPECTIKYEDEDYTSQWEDIDLPEEAQYLYEDVCKELKAFSNFLYGNKVVIEHIFGNNVEVILTRDSQVAQIDQYTDHD